MYIIIIRKRRGSLRTQMGRFKGFVFNLVNCQNDGRSSKACHYVALFQEFVDTPVNGRPPIFRIDLSLCVIHKEGLCPSRGDINRLMMMMISNVAC
jgi:hypothetical protein